MVHGSVIDGIEYIYGRSLKASQMEEGRGYTYVSEMKQSFPEGGVILMKYLAFLKVTGVRKLIRLAVVT